MLSLVDITLRKAVMISIIQVFARVAIAPCLSTSLPITTKILMNSNAPRLLSKHLIWVERKRKELKSVMSKV